MKRFIETIIRYRKLTITLNILLTLFLISQFRHLAIVVDLDTLLPQTHPLVAATNKIGQMFGNKLTVAIGVTATQGDIYNQRVLGKIQRITAGVMNLPGAVRSNINSLSSRKAKSISGDADGMIVRPLMEKIPVNPAGLAALRHAVETNPVYSNLLISKDRKTAQIVAEFKKIPGGFLAIQKNLNRVVDQERDESVLIEVGGTPVFLALLEKFSARMGFLFPLAVLVIGLIHYEAFRTLQGLILPLVTALMAVLWALGFLGMSGQPLDVINATTPILILAIAAGHAVQILKRYYEEYHRLHTEKPSMSLKSLSREAVALSLSKVGPVMLMAGGIAAIGFFSLVIFEVKSIQTFGIFTGFGILSALVLELTFIPALRASLPAPGTHEIQREKAITLWDRIALAAYNAAQNKRKQVYFAALISIAILSVGGYWLKIDNSQKAYFYGSLQEKQDDNRLNERLAGTNTFYILVKGKSEDSIKNPQVLRGIEAIQRFLEKDPLVGKTISIVDFIKKMNQAMHGDDPAFFTIPQDQNLIAQYLLLYSNSGEPGDFDAYVDTGYQNALITTFIKSDGTAFVSVLIDKVKLFSNQLFGRDADIEIGGGISGGVALTETMVREKILNILQIMAVVFIITSLVFRSVWAGMLILVPLLAAVSVNFGIMGLLGIPLQIGTVIISAMAVGIGADYGIYLSYRLREELRKGGDEASALRRAFQSAGKAILFVSSAVAGGFGILMLSWGFWIHLYLGFLISMAMLVSSASALTLFPALVFHFRPKFIFEERLK
jgi:predicted RND superfamily exporter protein